MTDAKPFRGHNLNNPAEYPARYETNWLRRRSRRAIARAVLVMMVFAAFVYPFRWPGALVIALLAGGMHFAYFWRRHWAATAWHKEAYAERRSTRTLLPLRKLGHHVLHDHFHGHDRIQTLMIGPAGVWLVHAVGRAPSRRLWGDAAFLHPERQSLPPSPEELRELARAVGETLTAEAGEPVTVRPVYLAVNEDVPESVSPDAGVPVLPTGAFRMRVMSEPARLPDEEVIRLTELARRALPMRRPARENDPSLPPMAVKKSFWLHRRGLRHVKETDIGQPHED